jgi:predicted kinase
VTGIQAAGKSTVARLLAKHWRRGVHVEADVLQHMIVSGSAGVQKPGEPSSEAAEQLRLRLKHACLLGRSFYAAGFSVVLDDIIIGARWEHLQEDLDGVPFSLVVLAPSRSVVQHRDITRAKGTLGEAWATHLDNELRATMRGVGLWIDSSQQTPQQTVDEILRKLSL